MMEAEPDASELCSRMEANVRTLAKAVGVTISDDEPEAEQPGTQNEGEENTWPL